MAWGGRFSLYLCAGLSTWRDETLYSLNATQKKKECVCIVLAVLTCVEYCIYKKPYTPCFFPYQCFCKVWGIIFVFLRICSQTVKYIYKNIFTAREGNLPQTRSGASVVLLRYCKYLSCGEASGRSCMTGAQVSGPWRSAALPPHCRANSGYEAFGHIVNVIMRCHDFLFFLYN